MQTADGMARQPRLSELFDAALPEVYRYLRSRCGSNELAEELTSAVFVRAALSAARGEATAVTIPWLITVARNILIDHWRHEAVAGRAMTVLEAGCPEQEDPWDAVLDQERAAQVLGAVHPHYRTALTLRYLDDLSVPECAAALGRSVHSMESLLVRARRAFRSVYEETGGRHD